MSIILENYDVLAFNPIDVCDYLPEDFYIVDFSYDAVSLFNCDDDPYDWFDSCSKISSKSDLS